MLKEGMDQRIAGIVDHKDITVEVLIMSWKRC